jgi:hypothetical protein
MWRNKKKGTQDYVPLFPLFKTERNVSGIILIDNSSFR